MIYFLLATELDAVKIGHTSREPVKRAREIQAQCPCELSLLRVAEGDEYAEARLHALFADHWVRGEWFRYSAIAGQVATIEPAALEVRCPVCGFVSGIIPPLNNYQRALDLAKGSRALLTCRECSRGAPHNPA